MPDRIKIRSLFLSDIHLGCKYAQTDVLNKFMKKYDPEYLYLVGDIIDIWQLKKSIYWTNEYSFFIKKVIGSIKRDTKVFYLTGNHDELFREFTPKTFGNLQVIDEHVHTLADGTKMLIVHGDIFDQFTKHAQWLYHLGNFAYDIALFLNRQMNLIRRKMGLSYWSLSALLKKRVKEAASFINNYEKFVVEYCIRQECHGVICGHIHTPVIKQMDDILYCNCGDWVESCSAIIETVDGKLELIFEDHHTK